MSGAERWRQGERPTLPASAQSLAFRTCHPVTRKPWDGPWLDGPWRASPAAAGRAQTASVGGCTRRHGGQMPHADGVNLEPVEVCPGLLFLKLLGLCGVA